ncbi:MAG: tripartite tricarboxylate transporter substrate binding protein [Variovorax sp.]|nr:tripartite tricarboxylate transporter substrate binding protein [Variovorax sp.]
MTTNFFPMNRRAMLGLGASAAAFAAFPALAQGSDKPIRFILPISAGSGVDAIARAASVALGKALGQPVVIENLPGAGGITGTSAVIKAPPDGFTLGMVSNNHVINPSVFKKMPFDAINDITPISVVGATPLVLAVNPKLPAKNVKELVALLRAKPEGYNYASSGNGTIIHLAGEMFMDEAGVKARHIPYKGTGPMVTDMIAGQVEMGVVALPAVQPHLKSGALRAIGVCGPARSPAAPDMPTIAEQGVPGYESGTWQGVVAARGTPDAVIARLNKELVRIIRTPDIRARLAGQGAEVVTMTAPEQDQFFAKERARWAQVIQQANLKLD